MSSNDEDVRNSLLSAVSCGDLEQVEELVKRHGLSHSPDFDKGYQLLLNATLFGYKEIVKFLLEKGVPVCSKFRCANTPLHFAVWFGNLELIQLLLDHKAPIDAKDLQYETPLHIACQRGHTNVVELLLNKGANPNAIRELPAKIKEKFSRMKFGQAVADSACQKGHEGFRELVKYGAQLDGSDNQKSRRQVSRDEWNNILALFESGVSIYPNNEDEGNVTPLHLAAQRGPLKMVELLLKAGAFVNAQTNKDSTPLLLAATNGHADVAKLLLEHGACANTNNDTFLSPLRLAVEGGHTLTVKRLLKWGAVIDDVNPDFSHLHFAVGRGFKGIVALLLNAGCDVSAKDQFGKTPISYSLTENKKGKHAGTIQLLLDRGADLNKAPGLLHKAVMQQNVRACQTLIRNGVDVNAYDNNIIMSDSDKIGCSIKSTIAALDYHLSELEGDFRIWNPDTVRHDPGENITPLQLACHLGHTAIAVLLLKNGASVETRQGNCLMPLHTAAARGHAKIVTALLRFGADIDARGESTETALHYAVKSNRDEIVLLLLENGCDGNIERMDGATAFELTQVDVRRFRRSETLAPSDSSRRQTIIKTFQYHFVKLKAAGMYVLERQMQYVNSDLELVEFQQRCEEEVRKMKCETLFNKYTLFSVFSTWSNPKHVRNSSVLKILKAPDNKYPIYKTLLLSSFKKNKKRLKLLDSAKEWLRVLLKTRNALYVEVLPIPSVLQLEEIVSYLSKDDLLNLINCGENLKRQLCR